MSIYARSDVSLVALSKTHGGCGETHSRPVKNGAPIKLWKLECPQCETHLRKDPLWGGLQSDIPETPDEIRLREDKEKRGQLDQAAANSAALEKLSNLPDALVEAMIKMANLMMSGQQPRALDTSITEDQAFAQMSAARNAATSDAPVVVTDLSELANKTLPELRDIARNLGAKTTRSKEDQLAILADHLEARNDE